MSMRIVKVHNRSCWPLIEGCKECDISYEIALPQDLQRKCLPDDGTSTKKYVVYAQCPVCGKLHEVDPQFVPEPLFSAIPIVGGGIMTAHD